MRDLTEFAIWLGDMAGSRGGGLEAAVRLAKEGASALHAAGPDGRLFLASRAHALGLLDDSGRPDPVRTAELIVLCSVLARLPEPPAPGPPPAGLVFTVPEAALTLVAPAQRLEGAVADVIRMSEVAVRIGGPFWDDLGFERLLEVLGPAVHERGVRCDFYVHAWEDVRWRDQVHLYVERLGAADRVRVWWYRGPAKSLMHAKFVLSDGRRGLLGSANLTSFGLRHHVEVGVPLTAAQCRDLEALLEGLTHAGLLTDSAELRGPGAVNA